VVASVAGGGEVTCWLLCSADYGALARWVIVLIVVGIFVLAVAIDWGGRRK
jgi:hypothetical protein